MEKYYTSQETMAILGISYTTLWRETKRGALQAVYAGQHRRFAESSIKKYLERRNGNENCNN